MSASRWDESLPVAGLGVQEGDLANENVSSISSENGLIRPLSKDLWFASTLEESTQ
jgi:hypothetical protein